MSYVTTIPSTAGGLIVTDSTSDQCRSLPSSDWGALAGLFASFRVMRMRYTFSPANGQLPLSDLDGLVVCVFNRNQVYPTSYAQAIDWPKRRFFYTGFQGVHTFTVSGDLNMNEWTATNAAELSEDNFGISMRSNTLSASYVYFDLVVEWDVEFKDAH